MRGRSRFALAVVASAIVLSACGGAQPRAHRHAASEPVSVRLTFASTTVDVGTPLQGVAAVTNNTGRDISVTGCTQGRWLTVGIATSRWTYLPVRGAVACSPSVQLVPGVNRFPFSVITTYRACVPEKFRNGRPVRPPSPQCMVGGNLPPLPDGYYVTRAILNGLPAGTRPPSPVHVTLLPRSTEAIGATIEMPFPEIPYTGLAYVPRYPTSRVAVTLRKVDDPATTTDEARFFDAAAARGVHFPARLGYRYVSFELTVHDVGRISLSGDVDAQVVLLGTDNNWYANLSWCLLDGPCRGPGSGGSYTLAPGKAATGDVTFAVPDGVRIGLVVYRTDDAQSGWGLVPAA